MTRAHSPPKNNRTRAQRMGFRIDEPTKRLVERAAGLECRKLTDYCLTALTEAAQLTIARHDLLALSDAERADFFDVLVDPPRPNERLLRAFTAEQRRVTS